MNVGAMGLVAMDIRLCLKMVEPRIYGVTDI